MKQTPPGWPRISVSGYYRDPREAIDWLVRAFDFEVRLKVEGDDGSILHSELTYGEGVFMVGAAGGGEGRERPHTKSPRELGGAVTQGLMVYVDDVEAHCKRAREAGATILSEPKTTDYGEEYWSDRAYEAADLDGHRWYFAERVRSASK